MMRILISSRWGVPSLRLPCAFLLSIVIVSNLAPASASINGEIPSLSTHQRSLIVNGDDVDPADYPFYVLSGYDRVDITPDMLCGASLIHSDIILTAAHCQGAFNFGAGVYNPTFGAYTLVGVDRQMAHPDYYEDIDIINSDLMVLRLTTPQTDILPVRLNADPDFPAPYSDQIDACGFGVTSYPDGSPPQELQVGYFTSITTLDCKNRLSWANVRVGDDILCVDPVADDSTCLGDSGGPLTVPESSTVFRNSSVVGRQLTYPAVQVGIVSFGIDCVADRIPDGNTRVSYFYDWIMEQICILSADPPIDCPLILADPTAPVDSTEVQIVLNFQHDFSAEDTTFAVRDLSTNKIKYAGPQYVPIRGETVESTFTLPPGDYYFEVYDSKENGLQNPDYAPATYPDGQWTLYATYWNGTLEELATGNGYFTTEQITPFRVSNSIPGVVATPSPTQSPTTSSVDEFDPFPGIDMNASSPSSSSSLSSFTWSGPLCFIVLSMTLCISYLLDGE